MQEVCRYLLTHIAVGRAQLPWLGKAAETSGSFGTGGCPQCWYINTRGKWLFPVFCSSVSVTLLLKCLGDVGLSGSPGKRAVRTNPGGLVSDRHCRVLKHWLFHEYPFLEKTTNHPGLYPALLDFNVFGHCFNILLKRKQIFQSDWQKEGTLVDACFTGRPFKIRHLWISLKSCRVGCQLSLRGEFTQCSLLFSILSVESPYSFQDVFWGI